MRTGNWFCTYTGVQFYLTDPHPDDVRVMDIAHALSMICRFGGHTKAFYSVGQHLVHCTEEAAKLRPDDYRFQFDTLLHDASEAYIGDVVRPLKYSMPAYMKIEEQTMSVIYKSLGLAEPSGDDLAAIKKIDDVLLMTERRDFIEYGSQRWTLWQSTGGQPLDRKIRSWLPAFTENAFLEWFTFLSCKVPSTL